MIEYSKALSCSPAFIAPHQMNIKEFTLATLSFLHSLSSLIIPTKGNRVPAFISHGCHFSAFSSLISVTTGNNHQPSAGLLSFSESHSYRHHQIVSALSHIDFAHYFFGYARNAFVIYLK